MEKDDKDPGKLKDVGEAENCPQFLSRAWRGKMILDSPVLPGVRTEISTWLFRIPAMRQTCRAPQAKHDKTPAT
jgi:hypothetical protein